VIASHEIIAAGFVAKFSSDHCCFAASICRRSLIQAFIASVVLARMKAGKNTAINPANKSPAIIQPLRLDLDVFLVSSTQNKTPRLKIGFDNSVYFVFRRVDFAFRLRVQISKRVAVRVLFCLI